MRPTRLEIWLEPKLSAFVEGVFAAIFLIGVLVIWWLIDEEVRWKGQRWNEL